jgi:hypothetical protein
MKRLISAAIATMVLASPSGATPAHAASPQDEKGKVCRIEQQCHWENFKKICVYVKVCR